MTADPKTIVTWVLALAVPVATAVVLTSFLTLFPADSLLEIAKNHFAAVVGLPISAVFCVFLVVVLQQTSGPVKFEGLGFKFEGTSGQVVLWVLCFLAVAVAIKLVWNP
jgi:predicted neutral ceramidase superfamily lipid hydrolase